MTDTENGTGKVPEKVYINQHSKQGYEVYWETAPLSPEYTEYILRSVSDKKVREATAKSHLSGKKLREAWNIIKKCLRMT